MFLIHGLLILPHTFTLYQFFLIKEMNFILPYCKSQKIRYEPFDGQLLYEDIACMTEYIIVSMIEANLFKIRDNFHTMIIPTPHISWSLRGKVHWW